LFFDDQDFDGQLLRALSYAAYGGAAPSTHSGE
jgi:hypothetical protein